MRFVTYDQLKPEKGIPWTRDHLRRKCNAEPPEFPRPIVLSSRRIVWDEDEVDAWCEAKRRERDAEQAKKASNP
jgi:predicted DNA-binding transcriptional regulator AlpA